MSSEKLDERLNGSLREAAAESEKGPKPSSFQETRLDKTIEQFQNTYVIILC
jgi:hypothetical protein